MIVLLGLFLFWHLAPSAIVMGLHDVPIAHRLRAVRSFAIAGAKGVALLPFIVLAPLVVPIALVFTPREANALPWWARPWDNDVSINGDQAQGEETYYAPGHERRSFHARFVWLVLRNRASWMALHLGHVYASQETREHWGDALTARDHEGMVLNRCGDVYQLYSVSRLGSKLCLRTNYGHKVWSTPQQGNRAMPICITASVLTWEGA